MQKIAIPPPVLPGFEIISSFTRDDVEKLTNYLNNISVKISLNSLPDDLSKIFDTNTSIAVTQTIASFSQLLEDKESTIEEIAKNLCESFNEQSQKKSEPEKLVALENNLLEIFKSYKNLGLSLKARELLTENENNFRDSRIISDLRLVFDEDLINKNRYGVIIHKLHINYRNEGMPKDIYLSLDLQDLKQLKEEVERALQKHSIINNDYSDTIQFVS
jgi:hypothetical protein